MGRRRRGIYILLEESRSRPCIQVPPTPRPATWQCPRPSARSPGNVPPLRPRPWQPRPLASTRVRRPCFRVAHPSQPGQAPPRARSWAGFPASLPGARFLLSPHPQPRGLPAPHRGAREQDSTVSSRPAAAGCAPVPPRASSGGGGTKGEACPTPATGRQWRRPATGAAWLRSVAAALQR